MKIQPFDFSVNLMRSILWQYEGAPRSIALARNDQEFFNVKHEEFWTDWYRDVFDLTTANRFGLVVWSRILDMPLKIVTESISEKVFGFGVENENFDQAPFGEDGLTGISIDLETARLLLRLRWVKLTVRPTVPNLNQAMQDIFGEGQVEVLDHYEMEFITYLFKTDPGYRFRQALEYYDALPRPSTLKTVWTIGTPDRVFGYAEDDYNFNHGPFGA